MSFLDLLAKPDAKEVRACFHPMRFARGECLLSASEKPSGCYLIDQGEVRIEVHRTETDSDSVRSQ